MVERAVRRETVGVTRDVTNVHVGCNLPNGLELQLWAQTDGSEMTPQGPRATKVAVKRGPAIRLRGAALKPGQFPDFPMYSGYAVTPVPKEFWDRWCAQNEDADVIGNRCLIAGADLAEVQQKAKEAKTDKVKSGMSPIDPKNPPSVGGGLKVMPVSDTVN